MLKNFWYALVAKLETAKASFATSGGLGVASAFFDDWRQVVLFLIAVAIGLLRIAYEVVKLKRLLKNTKAV